ncbi:hypothetical protein LTSEURB_2981 [Salmonella enterica subsp. enterica serovar Urbana str. R8-2977]|uniref:Uncharacterized protein n=1 Tax=Salmonella enterica subsp. enterica serovar Urbana str. R8-2977 TaxID=913084 RepID=G5RWR7_SALET|nr:hypothetical protein LTSEURB_2981 [Salmonella enterica subsp. enterica serovar Urbana str. R8-2977]
MDHIKLHLILTKWKYQKQVNIKNNSINNNALKAFSRNLI